VARAPASRQGLAPTLGESGPQPRVAESWGVPVVRDQWLAISGVLKTQVLFANLPICRAAIRGHQSGEAARRLQSLRERDLPMLCQPTVFVVGEDTATSDAIRGLAGLINLRCQTYSSGEDFLRAFDRTQCGCLVTELEIPGISGLQLQQRLAAEGVTLPVVFLTAHATLPIAVRAMRAGAFHFLEKPPHEQELWDVIQDAVTVDRERREAAQREEQVRKQLAVLTIKEERVLRMLGEGKPNRVIAKELDLSIRTIEVHRAALMKKLGVHTPEELVRFAVASCDGRWCQGRP
jgi:FixJ family two-component response regulator